MPLISDILQKKSKKFVKKEYRPWDENISLNVINEDNIPEEIHEAGTSFPVSSPSLDKEKKDLGAGSLSENREALALTTNEVGEEKNTLFPDIGSNQEAAIERTILGLYGLQRRLLEVIVENISYEEEGVAISKPLAGNKLAFSLRAPINSIKGSLQRLIKSKIIDIYTFKPGRGGYGCYKMPVNRLKFLKEYFKE